MKPFDEWWRENADSIDLSRDGYRRMAQAAWSAAMREVAQMVIEDARQRIELEALKRKAAGPPEQ